MWLGVFFIVEIVCVDLNYEQRTVNSEYEKLDKMAK